MAAPVGNKNSVGKGRKSAYQERQDAEFLWKVFIEKLTPEQQQQVIRGPHSIKEAWVAKMFAGNEKFIGQLVHKLFPDLARTDTTTQLKVSGKITLAQAIAELNSLK